MCARGMKTFKGQLFIFVIIYIHNASCGIRTAYNAGKEILKLHSMIDNVTLRSSSGPWEGDALFNYVLQNREIRGQMYEIHEQLNQMDKSMNFKKITDSLRSSVVGIILYGCTDKFDLYIESIDGFFEDLFQFMNRSNEFQFSEKLQELIQTIGQDMEGRIEIIHTIMSDENDFLPDQDNLVFAIAEYATKLSGQLCNSRQIISDLLVQLFTIVTTAEMKANIMLTFSNLYRFAANNGWYTLNSHLRDRFKDHFENYVDMFETNIVLADSLYLRACDPRDGIWIRDESFYEMERTFQATILQYHWADCKYSSCNTIVSTMVNECQVKSYDSRIRCSGTIADCFYLSAVQACALKSGPYKFQYVNSTKQGSFGRNFECPTDNGYAITDGKDYNINYASCACNCYKKRNKVSLLIMKSDVESNWVITGLRFLRQRRILYIQPKQGWVDAHGHINKTSEEWVRIPRSNGASDNHPIDRENRVFFLEDLRLLKGSVLTGVKFNKVTRGNVTGFAIEIFGAPFDFESGRLSIENIYRVSMNTSDETLWTALAFNAIRSADTTLPHTVSPGEMKYVSLKQSQLRIDFGQATLPFFDAVEVAADSPSPLSGIGIFHKGVEGYAGFISLRVYGISHAQDFRHFKLLHMENGAKLFD